ncbi:type IV pilus modification protein PilV [Algibacillus agarilyticus]|uniref:type IV pilus modification protein PilV n=1 Tax=Algibacillus agarilyticus TaxID=2234133 RepID=UPI000DCF65BA|nr:type IV pilus modification protein PilV [Algibacillus agarilyticus]
MNKRISTGFTLIELLIALIVVSIGVLGHTKLQLSSMQSVHSSRFTQSVNTAMLDLAQRIAAEPDSALNNEFNLSNLDDGVAPTTEKTCLGVAATCNSAEFALYEVVDWYTLASATIPQLRFSITRNDNIMTINVTWDAALSGSGVENCDSTANKSGLGHQCRELTLWVQ